LTAFSSRESWRRSPCWAVSPGGWMSLAAAGQPGRPRDTGQPTERGVMYPALRYRVGQGELGHR